MVERLAGRRRRRRPRQPRRGGGRRPRDRGLQPGGARAMEWTRRRIAPATRDWLAALPERLIVDGRLAGPRQPARPDLGVRHHRRDRQGVARRDDDAGRAARPHPRPDGLDPGGQPRPRRRPRGPTPGSPTTAGPRCSTRAASASRATATRGRATWSSTPTRGSRPGTGSPTTSRPSRRAMRAVEPARPPGRAAAPWPLSPTRRDRRAAAAPGPQAGRPAGPRRAAARAVLPLHGPGPADGQGGGQRPDDARRPGDGRRSAGFFFGRPLASEEEIGERLSKKKALAIFSSDAISSSAYATEEILGS